MGKNKTREELLSKTDALLDEIAELELQLSLARCKAAVDRLFSGMGPNRDEPVCQPPTGEDVFIEDAWCQCCGEEDPTNNVDELVWGATYLFNLDSGYAMYRFYTFEVGKARPDTPLTDESLRVYTACDGGGTAYHQGRWINYDYEGDD